MDCSPKCYLLPCVYALFGDPIALPVVSAECLTNCWTTPMRCWTIVRVLKNVWYIQRFEICSIPLFESRHITEQVGLAVTLQTCILKVHRISSMTVGVLINFLPVKFGVKAMRASFEILDYSSYRSVLLRSKYWKRHKRWVNCKYNKWSVDMMSVLT